MTNHSSTGPQGGARVKRGAGTTVPESSDEPSQVICTACQRPIEEGEQSDWRGEPVHFECGAELRCGVSIGPSTGME